MNNLLSAVDKAIDKSSRHLLRENDLQIMLDEATGVKLRQHELHEIRQQAVSHFKASARERVNRLVEGDQIEERLNALQRYSLDDAASSPGWRPTGTPDQDLIAHTLPLLQEKAEKLKVSRDQLRALVKEEEDALNGSRDELRSLHQQLSSMDK